MSLWAMRESLDAGLACGTDSAHGSTHILSSGLPSALALFGVLFATFVPGTWQPPLAVCLLYC